MAEEKKKFVPFGFPENEMGLTRGTVLRSISELTRQLGLPVGGMIILGYDGKYVRCMGAIWSIEQIQEEIQCGIWEIAGKVNLSDEELSRKFASEIEQLDIEALEAGESEEK